MPQYYVHPAADEKIVEWPLIGERRSSLNPRLKSLQLWRVKGFEKHLIFYQLVENGIEIVRVLHGARDIDSVLDQNS